MWSGCGWRQVAPIVIGVLAAEAARGQIRGAVRALNLPRPTLPGRMSQLAHTRPRSATEIIDASFRFYRARFGDLLVVSVLLLVPPVLLAALTPDSIGGWIRFAGILMYLAGQGAIAILVAASLERDESLTAGAVFRRLGRRSWTVILVSIVAAIMMMVGFVLLIIPFFIVLAWTATAVQAAAIEGLSTGAALSRARALARGRIGHILVTMILVWLLLFVVGFGVIIAFFFAVAATGLSSLPVIVLLGQLLQVPIFPLVGVVSTMLYYDLRVRSEGADVAAMIDALPVTQPEVVTEA